MPLPKLCCLTPYIIPGDPRGDFEGPTESRRYHAKPSGGTKSSGKAVVLLYDLFGFSLPNCQLLADEFADRLRVDVFVPDYIPNPPSVEHFLPIIDFSPHQKALSGLQGWTRWLKTLWAYVLSMPTILWVLDPWVMPKVRTAIEELKREKYSEIALIGYCRGGAAAIRLMAEDPTIKCGAICHPGPINSSLFSKITAPSSWHLADEDEWMADKQIAKLVVVAERKRAEGGVLNYQLHPETTHGFGARPNAEHPPSQAAFLAVKDATVAFISRHLLGGATS